MSHFGTHAEIQRTTPLEWLAVGAQIGQLVNDWAMRSDLIAYVGENAAVDMGAPALFNPASAEIEVNTKIAFGFSNPALVGDLRERTQQFEFPKASGAILHEALHARFSTWNMAQALEELTPNEYKALHLLEESRIEAKGLIVFPQNRAFLRACALEIVLSDMSEESVAQMTQTRQCAQALGLTMARVDARVLDYADIELIIGAIELVVPQKTIDALRAVWLEFQRLDARTDEVRMYDLAREWERIVKDQVEENGEDDSDQSGQGQPSEGSGSEAGKAMSEFMKSVLEAIAESAESAEISATDEAQEQQTTEEFREQAEQASKGSTEKREHSRVSTEVFGKGTGPSDTNSNSRLMETRKPTPEERVSAVKISQSLERAKYRDRDRVESASAVPPGRLRTRALVQANAYRAKGVRIETEPWNRVQHKQTDDPTLSIGVMVDISGSMRDAMNPMASSAWIMSEAVRRVQGKCAMVYYGNDVFPTLKSGQHLTDVNVYSASDGTEQFDKGFKALDGALNLLNGSGARLLVIVSDGEYTTAERKLAKEWLKRCERAGVGVLWVGAGHYGGNAEGTYCSTTGAQFVRMTDSATGVADQIGRAATEALTRAGSRR